MFTIPAKPKSCTWITTAPNNATARKALARRCDEHGVLITDIEFDVIIGRSRTRYTERFQSGARIEVGSDGHAYLTSANGASQIHTAVIEAVR